MRHFFIYALLSFSLISNAQDVEIIIRKKAAYTNKDAVNKESSFYGLRAYIENDFLYPFASNKDDNYTGGIKAEFITNRLNLLRLGKVFGQHKWDVVLQNVSAGVTIFTPQELNRPDIITTDRPYACYAFGSIGSSFVDKRYKQILGYELFVGKLGSQVGRKVQTDVHGRGLFGSSRPVPQGWDNQIVNSEGATAVNLRLFAERNVLDMQQLGRHFNWLQVSWQHELNGGQYLINYAQALRFNVFNINRVFGKSFTGPSIPVIANDINATRNAVTTKEGRKTMFNLNFYIAPRVRVVAHNSTLTGKLLNANSVYTIRPLDVIPALLEYDAGVNVRYCFLNAGYNVSGRSREFKFQQKAFHNWGGVYVALVYR
jgi:hypothetical protein